MDEFKKNDLKTAEESIGKQRQTKEQWFNNIHEVAIKRRNEAKDS